MLLSPNSPKTVHQTFDDQAISRYIEGQPTPGSLTGINVEKGDIVMSASLQSVPELSPTEYLLDVEEVARRLNVSPQWSATTVLEGPQNCRASA